MSSRETKGTPARTAQRKTATTKSASGKSGRPRKRRAPLPHKSRNPARTKENIIQAAIAEFSAHGMSGGRVERIAKASDVNLRMIYHYYGSKESLYVATLERVYQDVRTAESELHIEDLPPEQAIRTLVRFTFDHFQKHPHLVNLVMGENLLRAAYLRKSDLVPRMTAQLQRQVQVCLKRGVKENLFRKGIDSEQLWLTIFSLCWVPAANRHTISWALQRDLGTGKWLEERKAVVEDVVMQYLDRRPSVKRKSTKPNPTESSRSRTKRSGTRRPTSPVSPAR